MRFKGYRRAAMASTLPFILAAVSAPLVSAQAVDEDEAALEEITVTGIRSSLRQTRDLKKNSRGIVDGISAEDIGKFPDTNLAESLQRITGVAIDRQNGEGNRVTVRGFGPEFNLVTINGRQMPATSLEGGGAPVGRSFDFANLAAENVSGVQVYKTGRAAIPTGGIGSTINITTTRPFDAPGFKATIGAKAVYDDSRILQGDEITPEISGLYSNTFNDDTIGVAVSASYQKRDGGFAQVNTPNGWRGHYTGAENNWGTLAQEGDPRFANITNRPGPNDVYGVPQSVGYALTDISRERINGQATLQWRPADTVEVTVDYTFARNDIDNERHDVSVWFNHGDTSSAWTDGPVAGPIFYSENFGGAGSDLSFGGAIFATRTEINSIGGNIKWEPNDRWKFEIDVHDSTSESGANSPFGSDVAIGSAIVGTDDNGNVIGLQSQSVRFDSELPILSIGLPDGVSVAPQFVRGTGNAFRNSFQRAELQQAQFRGNYDFQPDDFDLDVDFGATYTDNSVRSAFSVVQNDTWGGLGSLSDWPDDIFEVVNLPENFDQFDGSDDPALLQEFVIFDIPRFVEVLDGTFGACGGDGICASQDFNTDQRTQEEVWSAFVQFNAGFEILDRPANLIVGLRYEDTDVASQALVPIPTGTQWVAENEFGIILSGEQDFTELTGGYDHWLPAIDFDIEVMDNLVFRASYSESITRPDFNAIQGGQTVDLLFRVEGGFGRQGSPSLLPFSSRNYDASLEWYYDDASYVAAGYFRKEVDNFIGQSEIRDTPFGLTTVFGGQRFDQAVAALGGTSDLNAIRNWIIDNTDPQFIQRNDNGTVFILSDPATDAPLEFDINVPVNQDAATVDGWEFALQHTFGDTGIGFQANYTIVSGDVNFDRTQPASFTQFALVGLSDTANIVGFYDKDGIQFRAAWNWRDEFLASTATAAGPNNPLFTEEFWQIDITASYDLTENITVFLEGINVTDEINTVVGRHPNELNFGTQTGARYLLGARYKF